jgi:hypothetical protein
LLKSVNPKMSTLRPKNGKGYLLSVLGGLCGATLFSAILISLKENIPEIFNPQSAASLSQPLVFGIIIGLSASEVLGCWAALRLGKHKHARTTAIWLAVLLIPGWILYTALSLLLGTLASAILLSAILPLIARLFTNDPRFPGGFARAMNTYVKRPFS